VLVAGAGTLRRTASGRAGRLEQARYVEALSHSATLALAGIAASGLYAAWRALGSLDNLTGNPYAGVLLVKLSLVAGAALLGGANRFLVMPGLLAGLRGNGAEPAAHRFALVLQVEALVLVAVLVAAAVLSSTSPPTAA
jgi:putative copper resistance protein D